jgi:hypothetical protein
MGYFKFGTAKIIQETAFWVVIANGWDVLEPKEEPGLTESIRLSRMVFHHKPQSLFVPCPV